MFKRHLQLLLLIAFVLSGIFNQTGPLSVSGYACRAR
jgi:hypothetical protein